MKYYADYGYLKLECLMNKGGLETMRDATARLLRDRHVRVDPEWMMNLHQQGEAWAWELARSPLLLNVAESFVGPNIVLSSVQICAKPPGQDLDAEGGWTQDMNTPANAFTINIAIDEVGDENGCEKIVPQYHLVGKIVWNELPRPADDMSSLIRLKEGDACIYHPRHRFTPTPPFNL